MNEVTGDRANEGMANTQSGQPTASPRISCSLGPKGLLPPHRPGKRKGQNGILKSHPFICSSASAGAVPLPHNCIATRGGIGHGWITTRRKQKLCTPHMPCMHDRLLMYDPGTSSDAWCAFSTFVLLVINVWSYEWFSSRARRLEQKNTQLSEFIRDHFVLCQSEFFMYPKLASNHRR